MERWRSVRTFFLLFALDAADLIVGAKGLEVVPLVREVDGRDKLLRELRRGFVRQARCSEPGSGARTWSTASCNCVRRSIVAVVPLCRCAVGVLWRTESSGMAGWAPLKKMVGSLLAWLYSQRRPLIRRVTYILAAQAYHYLFFVTKLRAV